MVLEIFDNTVVDESSFLPKYKTSLADISLRDYKKDYGFSQKIHALDIDSIETDKTDDNQKTMDAAIGIASYSDNKKSSSRFLLIELRLGYGNDKNASISEMRAKDSHTRQLLSGNVIDKCSYFIFNKDVAPAKRSTINRESKTDSALKNWVIVTPDIFIGQFHFQEDLPYQPVSPIDNIRNDGRSLVANAEYDKAIQLIQYWLKEIEAFRNKHRLEECKVLLSVVSEIYTEIEKCQTIISEDNKVDLIICEEELIKFNRLLA